MTAVHLVIHAGTHKTASTFLQHVLILNHKLLAGHGIYAQADAKMTGNHGTAWMTLLEDYRHVAAHVREAGRQGRSAALLSSEDFETLIFDHRRARLVEEAAERAGAQTIEWAFCLRDPGDYFASMMAQLSKLAFVDYLGALATTLRDGRFRVVRERKRYPYHWDFCLDYETHLGGFAKAVSGTVTVHDFRDRKPFPGHGIIAGLGIDTSQLALPGEGSRNARATPEEIEANRMAQLHAIVAAADLDPDAIAELQAHVRVSPELGASARDAISRLYAPGMERVLAQRQLPRSEASHA